MPTELTPIQRVHLLLLAGVEPERAARELNDGRLVDERRWTTARVKHVLARHPIPHPPAEPVWTFADQTRVALGGHITGTGPFADRLRSDLARRATGDSVFVHVRPHPSGDDPLDVSDPLLVCLWAKQVARELGIAVVNGPDLKPPPLSYTFNPDVLY